MYLFAGVKPRVNSVNPLNAKEWTLDELRKEPFHLWLHYIEPKILAFGNEDGDCWTVDSRKRNNLEDWTPQVKAAWDYFKAEHPTKKNWTMRQLAGAIFYTFPEGYCVYRDKDICNSYNCVRPTHLIIAPRNNARAKFGTRNRL